MKALARNLTPFCYALYDTKVAKVDSNGNYTGEYDVQYQPAVSLRGNISAARGTADLEEFGVNLIYSKTLIVDDLNCPIDENTVLWLDLGNIASYNPERQYVVGDHMIFNGKIYTCNFPTTGLVDISSWDVTPYNYVVVCVAKSLNHIKYAIKKVDVA